VFATSHFIYYYAKGLWSGMITEALVILFAFFLGSIPTAYIIGRLVKGIDIRKAGSGNIGAANVYRILGLRSALVVLAVDMGKGLFAVLLPQALGLAMPVVLLAGAAAVVGHNWSVFLRFQGGRGSATTLGVLVILIPREFLITLAPAAITFFLTRKPVLTIVILFAPLAPLCYLLGEPTILSLYSLALPALVTVTAFVREQRWKSRQSPEAKSQL